MREWIPERLSAQLRALGIREGGVPKHATVLQDGRPLRMDYGENDHCCRRFALADGWLRVGRRQAEGPVGNAKARLFRLR